MPIYIAADHRGFQLKEYLKTQFPQLIDQGATSFNPDDDYPDFARTVCKRMQPDDKAILLCGSGHGMDIAANRFSHIRAIMGFNSAVVEQGRAHEDANVLVLPADWLSEEDARLCIETFLTTPFSHQDRHLRRLHKLATINH